METEEEIHISPKLMEYDLRLIKPTSRRMKISRFVFKSIHKFAIRFKLKRLEAWSYWKWFNTYPDEQFGFWRFAENYLNCHLIGD